MADEPTGAAEDRAEPQVAAARRGPVPASAVVAPRHDPHAVQGLNPQHLYKAAGLLFLFAVALHFLEPLIRISLLAYAAAIAAVVLNAMVQVLPGRRSWLTGLLGISILALLAAALWIGVPILLAQVRDLVARVPDFRQLMTGMEQWVRTNTGLNINLMGPEAREFMSDAFLSTAGGGGLLTHAQGLLEVILVPLLILFGGLYAVGNPNDRLLTPLLRAVPRDRRLAFRRVMQLLGDRLLGWVRGILMAMLAVGILSYLGYWLAGVPNAFALAVFAGLTEAIPLVGPWIGGSVAVTVGLLESPTTGMYAAMVALAVQQVESNLITPWAMARAAEVHPFVTLFALVLFGTLFGFLGILLSIPIVLLIWTLVEVLWVERAIDTDEDTIDPLVEA